MPQCAVNRHQHMTQAWHDLQPPFDAKSQSPKHASQEIRESACPFKLQPYPDILWQAVLMIFDQIISYHYLQRHPRVGDFRVYRGAGPPGSRVPSPGAEVGIRPTCSIRCHKTESLIPHSGRCSARSSGACSGTAKQSDVRDSTWLVQVQSVCRMFRRLRREPFHFVL